jgi:TolB protein
MRKISTAVAALALLALAAPAHAAFPGTNGRIAYVSAETGNNEIYTINPDGTGKAQLTNDTANDADPSWSSDGQRIAFTSDRDGNQEIYVMNADGSGQTRLTMNPSQDDSPSWSPDGATIAVHRSGTGCPCIYLMDSDGTDQRFLVDGAQPAVSPDGQRMAFYEDLGVYTIKLDGTELAPAIPPGINECSLIE